MVSIYEDFHFSRTNIQCDPQKIIGKNMWKKSIANIDLDSIDYTDEHLCRKLLKKAKMEITQLHKTHRVQIKVSYGSQNK